MINSNFSFYGLAILLALVGNIIVIISQYKKYNYNLEEIVCLLLFENTGIIIGAKILSYFLLDDKQKSFVELGLASYGAVAGAILFIFLFCVRYKKNIK